MIQRHIYSWVLVVILLGFFVSVLKIHQVEAQLQTIYIRDNGDVDPAWVPIQRNGDVYTFTGDIIVDGDATGMIIERDNMTLDGAGYSFSRFPLIMNVNGISLTGRHNVTVKNLEVKEFWYGIALLNSSSNTISGNELSANSAGIDLSASTHNTLSGNNVTNNTGAGIRVGSALVNSVIVGSNNNAISANNIMENYNGIDAVGANFTTIVGNNIIRNSQYGIAFDNAGHNTVIMNSIEENSLGIFIEGPESIRVLLSGNKIASNADAGIQLDSSSHSTISENNISENNHGVYLWHCTNITISGNNITGNGADGIHLFSTDESSILSNEFYSNSDAGIRLTSSDDNTIQKNTNFSGSYNQYGIILWSGSDRNTVSNNVLSPYYQGISMGYSNGNYILNNTVSNAYFNGIDLQQICNNSLVANNVVSDSGLAGISIMSYSEATRYNVIQGNNIMHNLIGIYIGNLSGNIIYHNNIVDNENQTSIFNSTNIWNNDSTSDGNYWSNYNGVDLNHDGIGDTPHIIDENNTDYYPFMGMFHSFNTSLGKSVNVISNSTVESFEYESSGTIRFSVANTTENQSRGFCRVTIPHIVLSPPYNVIVNDADPAYVNYTLYDNGTHRWIYFEYEHSTREIIIIPEFSPLLFLSLFIALTLLPVLAWHHSHYSLEKMKKRSD